MSTEIENTEYEHTEHKLSLRNLQASDYPDIKRSMEVVYHSAGGALPEAKFRSILKTFPEGQICIEDDGKVIAAAFAVVVDYDKFGDKHTYMEITGNIYATTHDPKGDVLYGIDVFADPEYRKDMAKKQAEVIAAVKACGHLAGVDCDCA